MINMKECFGINSRNFNMSQIKSKSSGKSGPRKVVKSMSIVDSNRLENSIFKLVAPFEMAGDQPQATEKIVNCFLSSPESADMLGREKKICEQTMLGVTGSGKTFTMANIIARMQKRTLVLAPNKTLAAQLYAEFREFFPHNAVEYFVSYYDYYQPEAYIPATDTYVEKDSAINDEIDKLRHSATQSLLEREDVIVVASVSCIYGIGSPEEYKQHKITLFANTEYDRQKLLQELVQDQYTRNDMDLTRGHFRVRGDTVEVFPANEDSQIVRLQFFGDELESIQLVDPLLGKVIAPLNKVTIYPSSHYVVSSERMKSAMASIKEELRERLAVLKAENKLVEHQRLQQRTLLDLEMMEEIGFCSGIENYSRHLTGRRPGEAPPTLIDFFGDDFLIIIDESHITLPQVQGMFAGDRARKTTLVEHGFRLPSAIDNRPLSFDEFCQHLHYTLYVSATPADYEIERSRGRVVELIIRPTGLLDPVIEVRPADNQVEDLLLLSKQVVARGERILVTTLTKRLAEELSSYYQRVGMRVRYLHSDITTIERVQIIKELRLGKFDILVGINLLREGLDLPEVALIGIMDADKEGFLRSTRSLIQTIGRAARNANGKVVLYAMTITRSMRMAIEETNRRRIIQSAYNKQHGIVPMTVNKKITGGIMEALNIDFDDEIDSRVSSKKGLTSKKATSKSKSLVQNLTPEELDQKIMELKKEMQKFSKRLRFEEAAKIRDEIKRLSEMRIFVA